MRKGVCLAAGGSLLAATIGLFGGAAVAGASTASPVVGYTYVNDNTATANTIAGFDRHADGSLTPIPGSPFTIGGAGLGAGLGSQGAIQVTRDGRYLLAVDAGSNQISVLRIRQDGSLRLVRHGVTFSGGSTPVSIAVHSSLVYVATAGTASTNFTGFRLTTRSGHLFPVLGSTVPLASNSQPSDVLFNRTGTKLVGKLVRTSQISSFTVGFSRRLTEAQGSPFPAQALGPFGSEIRPTNPSQLFVSNAYNVGAGIGTGVRLQRLLWRRAQLDRVLAVREPADRPVLDPDQPRRPVPVLGQHRVGHHLPVLDRAGRHADAAGQHDDPGHRRSGRGGRRAHPGRALPVRRRERGQGRGCLRRQRRQPDRAFQLPVRAALVR